MPVDDNGKLRLLLVIILDVLLFGLGVFGLIRGFRHRKSWLLAAVVLCAPLVHFAGWPSRASRSYCFLPGRLLRSWLLPLVTRCTVYSRGDAMHPNQSLEPTAGRCDDHFDFIKQFREFATLAAASGGSAPSR